MFNRVVEFHEFQRLKDEFVHQKHWENEYRSQTKELLLTQLLEEQEKNYPMMNGETKEKKKFTALVNVLEEKAETPWLKEILKGLKFGMAATYAILFDVITKK